MCTDAIAHQGSILQYAQGGIIGVLGLMRLPRLVNPLQAQINEKRIPCKANLNTDVTFCQLIIHGVCSIKYLNCTLECKKHRENENYSYIQIINFLDSVRHSRTLYFQVELAGSCQGEPTNSIFPRNSLFRVFTRT